MTKELLIKLWIALTVLSLITLVLAEGLFHGLYIFAGFGMIGGLYIVITYWMEG